jgi:hypothetical protein
MTDPDQTIQMATNNLDVARANLAAIKDKSSSEYFSALGAVTQAQDALAKSYASHTGAIAAANAARDGGQIAAAQAAITTATAQMQSSAKGTDSWYQGLAAFYAGQQAMAAAVQAHQFTLAQLEGDFTDPVEQARDELEAAQRKLAADRAAGRGQDVIDADRLEVEKAQANKEQAAWAQKLSDMKVAEQLGNISHQQMIRYLERESERMHKMKNKSRQQIDHMNEIDLALKEAVDSMDGQFNLGDINTNGLVYQARRFKAEQRADNNARMVQQAQQSIQNVSIQFDGADAATVRRVLTDLLGHQGWGRRTVMNRKV